MAWLMIPDSGHSAFSAASAESTWPCGPGVELCATVKSIHTPSGFSRNRWQQVISMLRQSGMTLRLLDNLSLTPSGQSTASQAGSPARTSVVPAKEWDSKESEAASSSRLSGSFAWLHRKSSSWKTSQLLLHGGWESYCENWPTAGTMLDGVCYRRPTWERRIKGNDGGAWLTPRASESGEKSDTFLRRMGDRGGHCASSLTAQVRMFRTPQASDGTHGGPNQRDSSGAPSLTKQAHASCQGPQATMRDTEPTLWPTPTGQDNVQVRGIGKTVGTARGTTLGGAVRYMTPSSRDYKGPSGPNAQALQRGENANLCDQIGGQLNPTWVEWLMGYPLGWTALDVSATP